MDLRSSVSSSPDLASRPVIQGWLNHLKVGQKIALGYAAVLGITLGGALSGVIVGVHYEKEGRAIEADAIEEIIDFKKTNAGLSRTLLHEKDLINWLDDPDQFQSIYQKYQIEAENFQNQWQALLDSYDEGVEEEIEREEEIEALDNLVENYGKDLTSYFESADVLIAQIRDMDISSDNVGEVQQLLIDFNRRPESFALSEFSEQLALLVEDITEEELEEAAEAVEAAEKIRFQVILVSILLSLLIASLLAVAISRSINRPLKAVEEAALRVIKEKNFDLRSPVVSADEIGNLATSLNQLIEWVGGYTQSLKSAQKSLEGQASELNAVIDNLGDGLLVTDAQGLITRSNPALRHLFGFDRQALSGQPVGNFFNQQITDLIRDNQANPANSLTIDIALSDNRVGQALVTAITEDASVPDEALQVAGSVVLIRDVTAEKAVDQMKTDFISTVSHELRTPLTSVLGFAKLIQKKLEKTVLPAVVVENKKTERAVGQVRDNLQIIVSEGERLTSLINDVLDIAKIEAGKIEWNMQPISVSAIIERAIAATSVLSQNSGLKIIRDIEPDLPEVMGDRDRLMQVAINLLSNAIKFTDRGSVTCRATCQNDEITISIVDTGMGLAEGDLDKVFEKFKQVGEIMTDKPQGTGLGLPICKQIVEHHGGRIWAESTLGTGSTFSFTLPMSAPVSTETSKVNIQALVEQLKETVGHEATPTEKPKKIILVVDDEPHIRQLLRQELEAEGYQVEEAKDGMDAIQKVKAVRPDLIIMDVMMPNINGFDLAAVLKNDPDTADIPTIVLSIIQDHERGYRLGIDRYLSKPIDSQALHEDIKALLAQGTSNRKVLVVDMDTSATKTLTDVLISKGFAVTESTTDSGDIEKTISLQPDMVIVDSMISTEHELIKTLRFDKGSENIFVFMVESEATDQAPVLPSPTDTPPETRELTAMT